MLIQILAAIGILAASYMLFVVGVLIYDRRTRDDAAFDFLLTDPVSGERRR